MRTVSGKASIAGVIGNPVSHSLSPALHNYWLNKYGIDGMYIPIEMPSEPLLEMTLRTLAMNGIKGVNITLPYKEKALEVCDYVSDTAREIGAVNTIIMHKEGHLAGDNTDAYGFRRNLWGARVDMAPYFKKAVVLGAGGAAKAILCALRDEGCEKVVIANRTRGRAEALIREITGEADIEEEAVNGVNATHNPITPTFSLEMDQKTEFEVVKWSEKEEALKEATLLINTTSLGMLWQPPLDIVLTNLPKEAMVTDLVYNPLETGLLKMAKQLGHFTVDGLGMLLHQAVPGFTIWFDHKPQVTEDLRSFLVNAMQ